ncbi:MAG TPA: pirin family protein [Dysgonamonadaceae bacterium]|nr:pirin family protein [Dysgonamonadaceae bacterium]
MKRRTVELVVTPPDPHFVGDGFRVHNFIPNIQPMSMERMSPFILLDYASKFYFPPTHTPRGVGVHPHKGFETVTIAYKGKVAHHDSHGGGGVIGEGDVQWMTASSGILHKEYHEEEWSKQGGDFQMVQLWVNLPKKDKLSDPKYQAIVNADIPRYVLDNRQGEIEVIGGQYKDVKGAASTFSPMNLLNAKLNKGGVVDFTFPTIYNTGFVVIEGSVLVNGAEKVPTDHFVLMANDGEQFEVEASSDSAVVLVLSGEPIDEPIAARGPFVMNTVGELKQAFLEFYEGKFGELE